MIRLEALVIDDDEQIPRMATAFLKFYGVETTTADDGIPGVDEYKRKHTEEQRFYDLVLTDLMMPKLNGDQAVEEILKINPNAAETVYCFSGGNYSQAQEDSIIGNLGPDHFIKKPYSLEKIQGIVNQVGTAKLRQELSGAEQLSYIMSQEQIQGIGGEAIETGEDPLGSFQLTVDNQKVTYLRLGMNTDKYRVQNITKTSS